MTPLFTPSAFRKFIIFAVLVILFSPFLFSLFVNRWFSQNEQSILDSLNETFQVPVEISRIRYSLFKGIMIENFVLEGGVDPALPSPIHIARIRIRPSLSLFPHFGFQLGRVIFEEPTFSVRTRIPDMVRMGRFLSTSPDRDKRFGPFYLRMRLVSLKIRKGKITLLSPQKELPFQQAFEGVELFLGRRLFGGERFILQGHIAGNPKASFRIRANVRNPFPETTHLDLLFDCREFTTAYLKPHLGKRLELPDEALTATIQVKVRRGKAFVSKGKVAFQPAIQGKEFLPRWISFVPSSLRYEVRGEIAKERCRLKKLVLKVAGIQLKGEGEMRLSGEASAYALSISSGKIPARKFRQILPEMRIISGQAQLFFTLTGSKEKVSPHMELVLENCAFRDAARQIFWSKVDGRVRLSKNRIVVDEVWAFLNNFPLRIHGELRRLNRPHIFLEVSTYPGQVSILRPKNPLNVAFRFIGNYDRRKLKGDLWVTNFLYRGKRQEEKWTVALHGIRTEGLLPHPFPRPAFALLSSRARDLFKGRRFQCRSILIRQEGQRAFDHLAIRKASFFLSREPNRIQCDLLEGTFSQGTLFLQSWVEMRRFPNFSWTVTGSLSGADMTSLLRHFGKTYPVSGQLAFEGTWHQQEDRPHFSGRFQLSDGVVGPTAPLQRFADETGIEPLRQIQFHEFSGHMAFREGDLDLDHFRILSDQVELLANVKVRGKRLAGYLSAKFPEDSIRKSSDLKRLLRYVGGKDWIDFDFRVAGSLKTPRIQWLSGEFKRKVEAKLSPSMRKQLAREMEKVLSGRGDGGPSE